VYGLTLGVPIVNCVERMMDFLARRVPNAQLVRVGRLHILRVIDTDVLLEVEGIERRRAFLIELVAAEAHGD
jgi:hypothetical protein